jgi:hypothetical protein
VKGISFCQSSTPTFAQLLSKCHRRSATM